MKLVLDPASFTEKVRRPQHPNLLSATKEVVRGEKIRELITSRGEPGEVGRGPLGRIWRARLALDDEKCPWHLSEATGLGPGEPNS